METFSETEQQNIGMLTLLYVAGVHSYICYILSAVSYS
jgi:hypothetical protein